MKFGVCFRPSEHISTMLGYFKLVDNLGFDSAWARDVYYERSAWITLTAAAMQTKKVRLGSSVTDSHRTNPSVIASIVATVDELSNGRANLGIGSGSEYIENIFGIPMRKPFTTTREAIQVIRALWTGEPVQFSGEVFKVAGGQLGLKREKIPIYVGARGPKMHRLIGELADGGILHGVSKNYVRVAMDLINEGTKSAGRRVSDIDVAILTPLVIVDDRDSVMEEIRPWIASQVADARAEWYALDADEVRHIGRAYADHDFKRATSLVSEEMVDTFSIVGDAEECSRKVDEIAKLGVTQIVSTVLPDIRRSIERLGEFVNYYSKK